MVFYLTYFVNKFNYNYLFKKIYLSDIYYNYLLPCQSQIVGLLKKKLKRHIIIKFIISCVLKNLSQKSSLNYKITFII